MTGQVFSSVLDYITLNALHGPSLWTKDSWWMALSLGRSSSCLPRQAGPKMSEEDVLKTQSIARLRVHVERISRRGERE